MSTSHPGPVAGHEDVSDAEIRLLAAAASGTLIDLRMGNADDDDPAHGASWDISRQIRASLLASLLTGAPCPDGKPPRAVKLHGARITGTLNLEAATLTCPLLLRGCHVDEPVNLDEATAPAIRMPGCHLPGLTARQLRISGDLLLSNVRVVNGEIDMPGARIGGRLCLDGTKITNSGRTALNASNITVEQHMSCENGFTADGEVNLTGAYIRGMLSMDGAKLANSGGTALNASNITVTQSMSCHNGFTADGKVELGAAHIGEYLTFAQATASKLSAGGITVGRDMVCGISSEHVMLHLARIGGRLIMTSAAVKNIELGDAQIAALYLTPREPPRVMNLTGAKVGMFYDEAKTPTRLDMGGFTFDSLGNDEVSTRRRLKWLGRYDRGGALQLYDQLAAVYRNAGDEHSARKVAIAKQRRRRRPYSPLSWLWYLTVGYGYRPWLAGAWVIALAALGTAVFSHAYPAHMIATNPHPPAFHAAAYALDLLLPVVGLGQKSAWQPQGSAYQYWSWAFTGAGWVLTTAVVAGLAGILKRD